MGRIVDLAYDHLLAGYDIVNPDGSVISHLAPPTKVAFVGAYISTLKDLLPSYPILDLDGNGYQVLTTALSGSLPGGATQNDLLFDLNSDAQSGGVNGFVDLVSGKVTIVYSNAIDTKDRVLAEAFRVLKPGGRLAVSDIVVRGEIPQEIKRSIELWAGCVAGALEERDYIAKLERAGFERVSIEPTRVYTAADARELFEGTDINLDAIASAVDSQVYQRFRAGDETGAKPGVLLLCHVLLMKQRMLVL